MSANFGPSRGEADLAVCFPVPRIGVDVAFHAFPLHQLFCHQLIFFLLQNKQKEEKAGAKEEGEESAQIAGGNSLWKNDDFSSTPFKSLF